MIGGFEFRILLATLFVTVLPLTLPAQVGGAGSEPTSATEHVQQPASAAEQVDEAEPAADAPTIAAPVLALKLGKDTPLALTDGQTLQPGQYARQLAPRLRPGVAVALEIVGSLDGSPHFDELLVVLWDAGVREIELVFEQMRRRVPLEDPSPALRILHADSDSSRQAAVARLLAALSTDAQRNRALLWLKQVEAVPFDRAAFLPLVRDALHDPSAKTRVAAMRALAGVGGGVEDVPAVLAMLVDSDPHVRSALAEALYSIDPEASQAEVWAAIEELLDDPSQSVRLHTAKSLWGCPTSPRIDQMLVNLSYDPQIGGDVIYYALSTRPLVRKAVAQRLMELARGTTGMADGRALWGLTHHRLDDESRELATPLLIEIARHVPDIELRCDAIWGLGSHKHPSAEPVLRELSRGDHPPQVREAARAAIKAFRGADREPQPPEAT